MSSDDAVENLHEPTVRSFAREWSRFDQTGVSDEELEALFDEYFHIFPWDTIPPRAKGADIGCGTGRWARLVARRGGFELHCVDASHEALRVARANLSAIGHIEFHHASVDALPFEEGSLDFAYSLGVLHHVPDTVSALASSVRALKTGAPFLVYLYYAFDNRPVWFRALWKVSDFVRRVVARLPPAAKDFACDACAGTIYWPLARAAACAERLGVDVSRWPLSLYRGRSFYSMRTDARDRFGTPLEKRFTARQIEVMLRNAGLTDIRFSSDPPYWCAVGRKA